jgi:UDP-N-acetylmuramate--alanine ligase
MPTSPHPNLKTLPTHAHFVGIGGVGMSGIATILLDRGISVSGSDETQADALDRLEARGAIIARSHRAENLPPQTDLLVYSSAVPETNPERAEAKKRGIRQIRRGEFLAELAPLFETVIAIAGSHGKTTTTAMITHILRHAGLAPGYLVGGDVPGWTEPASAGAGHILVTEVDESDATQAAMHASIAVVTNIEDDHCWSVGGIQALENCFAKFANQAKTVVAWDQDGTRRILSNHPSINFFSGADIPKKLSLPVPGEHNRMNATLAIAAAERVGVPRDTALAALVDFSGVKRRLTEHFRAPDGSTILLEDYAHHPTELKMLLKTLRETFPNHQLTAIFQPHRFERVKRYTADFANLLSTVDHVVVFRPFAAWVGDGDLADPRKIAERVKTVPCVYWDDEIDPLAKQLCELRSSDDRPRVFTVIGAGDVANLVAPLRNRLVARELTLLEPAVPCRKHPQRFTAEDCGLQRPDVSLAADRSWAELTTLGIGSAHPLVAHPANEPELVQILTFANSANVPVLPLGNGSNLIGSDRPDVLLAIKLDTPEFSRIKLGKQTVTAGAGVNLGKLVRELIDDGRIRPELTTLGWIPGTLGGALRMNAGADGVEIGSCVKKLRGIRFNGELWEADGVSIAWNYRDTDIPEDVIITAAVLDFGTGNADSAKSAYAEFGEKRREKQPQQPSAGSVFKNAGDAPAGKLIDLSLGGERALSERTNRSFHRDKPGGDESPPPPGLSRWRERSVAMSNASSPSHTLLFSDKHANFIVRTGAEASEAEMERLMKFAMRRVFHRTGIRLRPEVVFVNSLTRDAIASAVAPRTIAVLLGGPSAEREISIKSGQAVANALRDAGNTVFEVDVTDRALPELPPDTDIVVPMLHGTFGEDGGIQELLEKRGIPYVGSGPEASRLMMDKAAAKTLLQTHGLPIARSALVDSPDAPPPGGLNFPVIVKPNSQGSSVGMTKLENANSANWKDALAAAFAVDNKVLVEEFVPGTEITVGVLHGQALPVIEIVPPEGHLFDFDAKYVYSQGKTRYICPPESVPEEVQIAAQATAVRAAELFDAKDMVRIDFIIDERSNTPVFIEANSIPGFTATSLLPKAAAQSGITFVELCAGLVTGKKIRTPERVQSS